MKKILILIAIIISLISTGCVNDYNNRLKKATSMIKVPVVSKNISSNTYISSEIVTYIELDSKNITDDIILFEGDIIGKCSSKDMNKNDYFKLENIRECD